MDFKEALSWLEELSVFGVRLGLGRIEGLLSLLGNPQEHYRTVHVTGTNGKGSVSAMMEGILRGSSFRTGLYTSPHLASYRERIRVDGKAISREEFADCFGEVKAKVDEMIENGEECPTQFEALTAAAFLFFSRRRVDYAVIEVGLGGLLDSTNVLRPEVSVITNVTLEHADKCGGTLEGIARHKAGIIKEGVPVVTGAEGLPLEIIRQEAKKKGSCLYVEGVDFFSHGKKPGGEALEFTSSTLGISRKTYELPLKGEYQVKNSAVAVMAAEVLALSEGCISWDTLQNSLRKVVWPGRFELMQFGTQRILLDGAHNPAGAKALRRSLDLEFPTAPRVFLLGILRDKGIAEMVDDLLREGDTVIATVPNSERAAQGEVVAEFARRKAEHVESLGDAITALDRALALAGGKALLVVAGSLYLVGGIRQELLQRKGESHEY